MASPSLHAATRRGNGNFVRNVAWFRATRPIHDTRNPQEPKPLQISHLFTRGTGLKRVLSLSLSGSKLFTTAAVYARLDIYLQRERNGAAVSETAEQPSGNKEAVGDELYPKNRGALCASARYSCFLGVVPGNATVIPSRSSSRIFSIPL